MFFWKSELIISFLCSHFFHVLPWNQPSSNWKDNSRLGLDMNKWEYACHANSAKISLVPVTKGLRIQWKLSTISRTIKKALEVIFWYVKVYVFGKFIQYSIHYYKIQALFPWDKIFLIKNALISLSRAPIYHTLIIFNSQFLYELKHKESYL